jgi:hypothetical protein
MEKDMGVEKTKLELMKAKIDAENEYLENVVIKRYDRRLLIDLYILTYTSPRRFSFDGVGGIRGFLDVLVAGDTRTGKSSTMSNLLKYFRKGEFISGENITKVGLDAGVDTIGGERFIVWGKIPRNDRGLVCIDEISSLSISDISGFSGLRSEGISCVSKIKSSRASAETRKIWIGNPRSGGKVSSYAKRINLLYELIGRDEDIARFDAMVVVPDSGLTPKRIKELRHRKTPPTFGSDMHWRQLVSWVWSRKEENIEFPNETIELCYDVAEDLVTNWTTDFPMVVGPEQHERVARIAAAYAGRLCSTDEKYEKLIVLPEHVHLAKEFIERLCTDRGMDYETYRDDYRNTTDKIEKNKHGIIAEIRGMDALYPTILRMFNRNDVVSDRQREVELSDLADSVSSQVIPSYLDLGLIVFNEEKKGYEKTSFFNTLLRHELKEDLSMKTAKAKSQEERY